MTTDATFAGRRESRSVAPMNEELTATIRSMMPYAAALGIEVIAAGPDGVTMTAPWAEHRTTAGGVLHGGFLMAVADSAGATLAFFNLPSGARTATLESKTNFIRPVLEGPVTVESTLVHKGRQSMVVQTDVSDGAGKLVSRTTQTQMVLDA